MLTTHAHQLNFRVHLTKSVLKRPLLQERDNAVLSTAMVHLLTSHLFSKPWPSVDEITTHDHKLWWRSHHVDLENSLSYDSELLFALGISG